MRVQSHSVTGSMDRRIQPAYSSGFLQCWKKHVLLWTKLITTHVCTLKNREWIQGMEKTQLELPLIIKVSLATREGLPWLFFSLSSSTSQGLKRGSSAATQLLLDLAQSSRWLHQANFPLSGKYRLQPFPDSRADWCSLASPPPSGSPKPTPAWHGCFWIARGKTLTYWMLLISSAMHSHVSPTAQLPF